MNSYDEIPYASHPYAQSHPDRLATVATLFGLTPPPVEKCRVLELGCAAGGNLIPMAELLPGSWFVGVDLSARQIADGEKLVRRRGLDNISLRHASILDVDDTYGSFDYVICHGVFSWVPDEVRAKILDVCAKHLTPQGIAYISYNTYPGWHMRGMIRDMMRYHATRFDTPELRTRQARALLDFLATSARKDGGAYAVLLNSELEMLRQQADHYLYHEHLEDVNQPLYFHQFAELAATHGLQYLGEARLTTMVTGNFGPDVEKFLKVLGSDQIQTEQYMDFVRNRTFRETLLMRADARPEWTIDPQTVHHLHVASNSKATASIDVRSDATAQYRTRSGMTLSTTSRVMKAAMQVLTQRWPGTVPYAELTHAVEQLLGEAQEDANALALGLLNTYIASDLLELHALPLPALRIAGKHPLALRSARLRAADGEEAVTNARHESFRPGELDRQLLPLLDGSRDRAALADALTELAVAGTLTVQKEGEPIADRDEIRAAMTGVLEKCLDTLALAGVIVG